MGKYRLISLRDMGKGFQRVGDSERHNASGWFCGCDAGVNEMADRVIDGGQAYQSIGDA